MAEIWLHILHIVLILGLEFLLIGLVSAIIFVVSTGWGRWQDRRQARRFAESAARSDFEEAETAARGAFQQAGRTDLVA
jgi:hypothetical protein